ncbi:phosphate ABC transporter substrate-binding protein (plasmid) [Haloferax mediterranei ATCC 33500]|uniref:ABC-type phosphate transport system, substrate binding protein n=1 Tax=Haloferax mediterranei (strain ATCC 33500 / DSM 1411 / JCM 8866 / NBRC 14739 / NCIMB 2177 / R-4) TaxID=523841 RepID=I3RBB6_HALMT|nr:substrate-binding domain-containing protein [Haloferax mediterranei]AFK21526.1 ABC-type phosphate transport system, substrate binding protein [Haloferax mediterranei ATCC 33500]AHZ24421.1 phosphate ABC transporter substrate-binding protein [Haloferax mediterranei ATCC 33500]ELZ97161.1 phosphate ABC transporter substrate binding protein [Haloferax mediterranei ATCC 33500]MDX5990095.1 substrate-binding domain-containing protein [Haloferax mediterranei ATCC 33500]QCQ76820.1 phosphate ABC trans
MAHDSQKLADSVSRREFIVASGAAGIAGLAGCSGQTGDTTTEAPATEEDTSTPETEEETPESTSEPSGPKMLTAEGSSTVYPIANRGSSYWNSNAPPSDGEYWGSSGEGTVPGWEDLGAPDMRLADYFASLYGFEPTETQANPPFATSIGLSHSGTGCKSARDGLVDIGNSSGPITAELGISEEKAKENYVDHVVGRDGQPVVVSKDIYDAGVTQLTGEEIKKIYQDDITNWKEVGGPDKEIYVVGRAEGSGTDTSFRLNMLGDADAPMPGVDTRKGQNQQVATVVQQNEGAIAYMALAFTGPQVKPIAINFEGTVYKPDKDAKNTIFDSSYPLNRDLHQYTTITEDTPSGTDKREAAFINMFLTTFGQKVFVEDNNYIPLPTKDIEAQKDKLPEQA